MNMQAKAQLRNLRIAPRKVRLLIDLIRSLPVEDAIHQLEFSKKRAARPVLKLLKSAIANAVHNHEIKEETLVVKTAFVDGGAVLHRWKPRAFGRAAPIRKRSSHITIILEGEVDEKKKKTEKKTEKVKAEKKEDKKEEKPKVEKKKEVKKEKKTETKKKEVKKTSEKKTEAKKK